MSSYIIHILLLDGKILCLNYKELMTRSLIKNLCNYLNLEKSKTVGLLYKDSRGSLQWLDETKMILDHDIATDNEFIPLIFRIRHIPHHVCYNEANIHQLFLLALRRLRQNWFIAQPEIHSQLVALHLLFKYGRDLCEPEILDAISQSSFLTIDPVSDKDLSSTIATAYLRYRETLGSTGAYVLKILQLTSRFPVFNSRLFAVTDAKGQKFILGINSQDLSLFHLDQYHNPFMRYKYSDIANVMSRGVKIIIDLKYNKSSSFSDYVTRPINHNHIDRRKEYDMRILQDGELRKRSLTPSRLNSENEMVTFYALSTHQSSGISAEIQASWNQFKDISTTFKISDLMRNSNFIKSLSHWLFDHYVNGTTYSDRSFKKDGIDMFLVEDVRDSMEDSETMFGEVDMFDSDIYQRLTQQHGKNSDNDQKPDWDQLLVEENRLKLLLKEKLGQLQESFLMEEKITGVLPKEASIYFPNGLQKFQRNTKNATMSYHQHRGCAASVRNKFITMDQSAHNRLNKPEVGNTYLNSSKSGSTGNIKTSRSVTDLSSMANGNGSYLKMKSDSLASIRSYDDKKLCVRNKSTSNVFFDESARNDQKLRIGPISKSKYSTYNVITHQPDFTDNPQNTGKFYFNISESKGHSLSPRSDNLASRTSLVPRSTNSSPLISHSISPNKRFNRHHDQN